ncbi:putative DNA-binding protein [Burkholderiales bacterium 8X]|nr:putative DNA-binding protein [Burkholderiales bacterium 8X]
MEYTFTLRYRLAEIDGPVDSLLQVLAAAGCDDALVGIGLPGRIALEFVREASDAREAVLSAMRDVKSAVPGAVLIEAAPDLVGLSEVAELAGVSRQNMRQLMNRHASTFPAPVHEGSTAVWHLADLLAWLQARGSYSLDPLLLELARTTLQVNLAIGTRRAEPDMTVALEAMIA